jgi:heme/copper-type cytochrome/quinol oxidase subunit 3
MSSVTALPGAHPIRRQPAVPSVVLGTIVFVLTEIMYFSALISSFLVIRSRVFGEWTPPMDIRLPVVATAFNTAVLTVSGVLMYLATRAYARPGGREKTHKLFVAAILLGGFFLVFQGYEWVKLIGWGMTMQSGIFGATFFMLVGSHGLHVLAAVIAMGILYKRFRAGKLKLEEMRAMRVFWLFVVAVWPVLYRLVYFG